MTDTGHGFDSRQNEARACLACFVGAKVSLEQGWHSIRLQKLLPEASVFPVIARPLLKRPMARVTRLLELAKRHP